MPDLRIALFAPYLPLPARSGGRIRIAHFSRALSRLGEVHLFAQAGRSELRAARPELPGEYASVHVAAPGLAPAPALPARVRRGSPRRLRALFREQHLYRPFDLIVVEHAHAAAAALHGGLPWLLDEHNVESEYLASKLRAAGPLYPWHTAELRRLRAWQARCWRRATAVAAVSEDERAQIEAVREQAVAHVPNGVCSSELRFVPPAERRGQDVLFVGLMDHPPNVQVAELLARRVMPRVWQTRPAARLVLCGGNPARAVRGLAGPRVEVTGSVPSVAPYLERARVFANALRQGAGTSLKVLEALATGVPLVSTAAGVRGFGLVAQEHYLPAETPEELAAAIADCLGDASQAAQLRAARGRQLAEALDWQHAARSFAALALQTARLGEDCMTRMDAILPLRARDLPRASILLRSLRRHFDGLGRLWVVAPARELSRVRDALPALDRLEIALLAETQLIPELAPPTRMAGWYRQQLIKLAIAERIATPNYLTLDADVICTRRVTPEDLAPDGKGLCHVIEEDLHPHWYIGSSQVLGLSPVRSGILHNVTPAVLSRQAVLDLQAHLEARAQDRRHRGLRQALRMRLSRHASSWRSYLITGVPWTEYALYYTYLEATGQLEHHHTPSERCSYAIKQSIWYADRTRFDDWQPAPLFSGSGAPWFAVVQSNTGLPPAHIWAKVGPYIEPA